MSQYRICWVACPDCGRSSDMPGGCYIVQRKGWLLWHDYLVAYDRAGDQQAEHYRSEATARHALRKAIAPKPARFVVVSEFLYP